MMMIVFIILVCCLLEDRGCAELDHDHVSLM